MKVAIIGSRNKMIENLEDYLPAQITEIVSGGATGIDTCAKNYAVKHQIKLTVFLPSYQKFGRVAPLKRNIEIVHYADQIFAFWDGKSKGTKFVIQYAKKIKKPITVILLP